MSRWVPISLMTVAVVLVAGAIVSISVGENTPTDVNVSGSGQVQRLYGGIDQDGNRVGEAGAPVTISVFNDLQCASCTDWHREVIPGLLEQLVRTDEAALELRHFSMSARATSVGALAATAAGIQGAQWQFADLFFLNQFEAGEAGVGDEFLEAIAAAVPSPDFDVRQWRDDFDDPAVEEQVTIDADLSIELRLAAEPAVVVDGPGGSETLERSPGLAEILAAVEKVR